jgi:energy-coupling factor transporter ATP-binding protein EcfA2
MTDSSQQARWVRDVKRFIPLKSQFVLSGNVRDLQTHQAGGVTTAAPLRVVLRSLLQDAGYASLLEYNPVAGFSAPEDEQLLPLVGLPHGAAAAAAGVDLFTATLERLVNLDGPPAALIADFASRLVVRGDALSPAEHHLFTTALVLSQTARARPIGPERTPLFNTIIWIVEKEGDLPDWLTIENHRIRHVPIPVPDRQARRAVAPALLRSLPDVQGASTDAVVTAENDLVDATEGLLLSDLSAITQLARSERVAFERIGDAVRRYKVGVTDDPWRKIERRTIQGGEAAIGERVIGQGHAVTHMLDIVKRAATGLSGGGGSRPRGVAFLAGPTGVGKTELAKAVTELLFGDPSAYIRFDMSEFSAEHADQRLIGAPPGYVGYDVGGELTNAIREKPFSVVLFDEIEKAHPRILDKFLQILDDGVLTSGRGDRVYFSEALIIFTSNLGIYTDDGSGVRVANVGPDQPFEEVRKRVRSAIENHFKLVLNRPEILNRFGENIIVFDFIRPAVAEHIFDGMVDRILIDAAAAGHAMTIAPAARAQLKELCIGDLSNGGRGIRNKLEVHLINPLARALFQECDASRTQIASIASDGTQTYLTLAAA